MATDVPLSYAAGKITPVNNVGTGGAQVIGINGRRSGLRFHNPGIVTLYAYSLNTVPAPSLASLGGAYIIFPQNDITIYGGNVGTIHDVNGAWGAFSVTGSTNPLTIMEFTGP
jgi:hypothetical protein